MSGIGESFDWEKTSRSDLQLYERALIQRWPISDEQRKAITQCAYDIVKMSKSARAKISAMKVLLAADLINLKANEMPGQQNHLHLHGGTGGQDPRAVALELMMNPQYLEFLRKVDDEPEQDGSKGRSEECPTGNL